MPGLIWHLQANVKATMTPRLAFFLVAVLVLTSAVWGSHTLTAQKQVLLKHWLSRHSQYRLATVGDCDCAADIEQMRAGRGGAWKPVPDYNPYIATGDFNGDGAEEFAVVVIDPSKKEKNYALLIFNGPFDVGKTIPNFFKPGLDLKYMGLFYGPPRPKPFRLLLSGFDSDSGSLLIPRGQSYLLK
jgi:hypothetical protein